MTRSWIAAFTAFLLLSLTPTFGQSFDELHSNYVSEGFTHEELEDLFNELHKNSYPRNHVSTFIKALRNPYAPAGSHAGKAFFEALAWYNDMTKGNRDGMFSLQELDRVFTAEMRKYVGLLQQGADQSSKIHSWKMLQKIQLLKNEITSTNGYGISYPQKAMMEIDYNSDFNINHTIHSKSDFQKMVLDASYEKPVLVKYGLTYCIHCLLLENLASIPAVYKKYQDKINVFKVWWNPKDARFTELNELSQGQGVKSSPYFILYKDGKKIKEGYVFPEANGNGMEEFLAPIL